MNDDAFESRADLLDDVGLVVPRQQDRRLAVGSGRFVHCRVELRRRRHRPPPRTAHPQSAGDSAPVPTGFGIRHVSSAPSAVRTIAPAVAERLGRGEFVRQRIAVRLSRPTRLHCAGRLPRRRASPPASRSFGHAVPAASCLVRPKCGFCTNYVLVGGATCAAFRFRTLTEITLPHAEWVVPQKRAAPGCSWQLYIDHCPYLVSASRRSGRGQEDEQSQRDQHAVADTRKKPTRPREGRVNASRM